MEIRTLQWVVASALVAGIAAGPPLAAQGPPTKHHRYMLVDMGTLGGPESSVSGPCCQIVNNSGTFVAQADTSIPHPYPDANGNPFVQHAIKWQGGVVTDLGALPGGGTSGTTWISDSGIIAGASQNGVIDPLSGILVNHAAVWNKNQIVDLGTLGGVFGLAVCVNNKGQAVGFSDNGIPDPLPMWNTGTQTRAFLSENGVMQDLGTLGGLQAMALYINERGQVAGHALKNSIPNPGTGVPTLAPFLWEKGRMIDLGGFGGTFGVTNSLNQRGQVVGNSDLQGDQTFHPYLWQGGTMNDLGTLGGNYGSATWVNDAGSVVGWATPAGDEALHATLWMHGAITDLGTLDNDLCSFAFLVNAGGQVVGVSNACQDPDQPFLWENGGPMVNLNTLIVPGSEIHVRQPMFINDRGEIGGSGRLPNGDGRAVLLIPCDGNQSAHHPDPSHCDALARNAPAVTQHNATPPAQPVSKETQARLVRETMDKLRTQSSRYHPALPVKK
jgi:probable HAF family extracellular repeat protein